MAETHLLQILIDGQNEIKKEIKDLGGKLSQTEERLTQRIDSLGRQLNTLDEDAPTGEEFKELKEKVDKYIASN
jgi:hypothetical protein